MTVSIGDALPNMTLKSVTPDGPMDIETGDLLAGKKIVLVAMPGAFTGTCSLNHLPGYLENRDALMAKGMDSIVILTINDPFVVGAWAKQSNAEGKLEFLADWDGAFTKAVGMDIDLSVAGLGVRSRRYAMIVDDGKVTYLAVEDSPGEAKISGAAALLEHLA